MVDLVAHSRPPHDAARFAQLLYTSYDNGGRGGWQVKQVVGELAPAEQDFLVNRVVTAFDLEPRLPDFPSEDDLATRPARLSRGLMPTGDAAIWHTVDAGRDGSGRPGNVFAHVLVERPGYHPGAARPIALWGSDGWLRPYGAAQVAAAALTGTAPPEPNRVIDVSSAIEFVIGSMERQAVFRLLMEAVVARLTGGPAVVLRVADHERAASWLSSVSHFLPRSAALRLTWTTHDRLERAALEVIAGTDIVCMPTAEPVDGGIAGAVVLAEGETPALALPGGTHSLGGGAAIAATEVSSLLEGVLSDADSAADILARQDEIDANFHAENPSPAWTLAVAVRAEPDLAEFAPDADKVIAAAFPLSARTHPSMADVLDSALASNPMSVAQSLSMLRHAHADGKPTTELAEILSATILRDGSWRRLPIGAIPPVQSADLASVNEELAATLAAVRSETGANPTHAAATVLRLAETVRRLAAPGPAYDAFLSALGNAARTMSVDSLGNREWPSDVPLAEVDTTLYRRLVLPLFTSSDADGRRRVPAPYWRLFGVAPDALLPDNPTAEDLAVYPYAALAFLRAGDPPLSDDARRVLAREAIAAILDADVTYVPDSESRRLTGELLDLVPEIGGDIAQQIREYPHRITLAPLLRIAVSDPADPARLNSIAYLPSPTGDEMVGIAAAACLRLVFLNPAFIGENLSNFEPWVGRCCRLPALQTVPLAPDLASLLDAGLIIARSRAHPWADPAVPAAQRIAQVNEGHEDETAACLALLLQHGVVDPGWPASVAFLGDVAALRTGTRPDRDARIAARLLDRTLRDGSYRGPTTVDQLRDACWPQLRIGSAADAEAVLADLHRGGRTWLRNNIPAADASRVRFPSRQEQ